ncbi:hypothetical protein WJ972_11025 [Achromobacter insuavis]
MLRTALSGILCGAALAAWPVAAVRAQAAPAVQEAERGFAIAAGPLDQALNQFARAAGVNVSFDASQVERAQTQGLNGRWTTAGGLAACWPAPASRACASPAAATRCGAPRAAAPSPWTR